MPTLLRHACSESCYKYSDASSVRFKICRHGFYHVVNVFEGCRVRRKGKALRPSIHIGSEAEADYGMQGRMRPIQLTPFECQTCYGGLVAGRHNLDLQDMRRVLDPALWLDSEEHLPHVGFTDSLGYMAWYEWNGKAYEVRSDAPSTSVSWLNRRDWAPDFRSAWLTAHQQFMEKEGEAVTSDAQDEDAPMPPAEDGQQDAEMATAEETDDSTAELTRAIRCGISEAFCDGINSGFYINSYTTKPGPGLAGMLEELQKGPQKVVFFFPLCINREDVLSFWFDVAVAVTVVIVVVVVVVAVVVFRLKR